MRRRQRISAWTRTGCSTCKRRHKKCDGRKPECMNCVRQRLHCGGFENFRFVEGPRTEGRSLNLGVHATGASSSDNRSAEDVEHVSYTNEKSIDESRRFFQRWVLRSPVSPCHFSHKPRCLKSDCPSCRRPPRVSLRPNPEQVPSLSQRDWQHLQYFFYRLSYLVLNAHTSRNPLLYLAIPLLVSSPSLPPAICSTAAQHRANTAEAGFCGWQLEATKYYVRALRSLKTCIPGVSGFQNGTSYHEQQVLETILLSSIFLCKYEVIKDGIHNWRQHLAGIASCCDLLEQNSTYPTSEIAVYARSFLEYHEGIASITLTGHSDRRTVHGHRLPGTEPGNPIYIIDPYMGLSRELVMLLHRISMLPMSQRTSISGRGSLVGEIQLM